MSIRDALPPGAAGADRSDQPTGKRTEITMFGNQTTSNGYRDRSQDPNLDHSNCGNNCHAIDWPAVKQARQVLRDSASCDCSDRPGRHTRGQCDNT